jgi:hypothetical protein
VSLTPALLAAWESAFPAALAAIRNDGRRLSESRSGWVYPKENLGKFGTDYPYRARVAVSGLGALEPAEAMYMQATRDAEAAPLDGRSLPAAAAAWRDAGRGVLVALPV